MTAVCKTLGVARSNIAERSKGRGSGQRGRPPEPDGELVAGIEEDIKGMPTYGYRRVHALLRRKARDAGTCAPNQKRVYRVMKLHGLLLNRHAGGHDERRHDGRVAVDRSHLRWSSDGKSVVTMARRSASPSRSTVATARPSPTSSPPRGIKGEDVRDLMITAVESPFG